MNEYVLCKRDAGLGSQLFVCGPDPRLATLDYRPAAAVRFPDPDSAAAYRARMGHQFGGTDKYHVNELLPGGRLVDLEA
jgi:hypothetical protein